MRCQQPFLYDCKCPYFQEIVHTPYVTYCPKGGLLVIEGRLYLISRPCPRGPHFIKALLGAIESDRFEILQTVVYRIYQYKRIVAAVCTNPNGSTEFFKLTVWTSLNGMSIIKHVQRLQKWARNHVGPRSRERRLALAMALHPRLGGHSLLSVLGEDVLGLLC